MGSVELTPQGTYRSKEDARQSMRRAFVYQYMTNGAKPKAAAMSLGFSEKWAAGRAHRFLQDPVVQDMIAEYRDRAEAENLKKYSLTNDKILREVARVAYFSPKNLLDKDGKPKQIHELDDDTAAALAAVEIEVNGDKVTYRSKAHNKNAALDSALKVLGLDKGEAPPPPDETGSQTPVDSCDMAKRILFALRRGAPQEEVPPETPSTGEAS